VSDDEARSAMAFAFRQLKLVIEPGGAVALAAVLSGKLALEGRTVAVVLSGGNVDPALFADAITGRSA
jgi:threonine dehydratase